MRLRATLILIAALAAGLILWRLAAWRETPLEPQVSVIRESQLGVPLGSLPCLAISADGSQVAFITTLDGREMLALADLGNGASTATIVSGTEGARHPSWSTDGRWIAFATEGGGPLKKLDTRTHDVSVASATGRGGSAWNARGHLLYTAADQALHQVDASGRAIRVTTIDPATNEVEHAWPAFLPDGNRFIYLARTGRSSESKLYLSSLDAPHERRMIAEAHSAPLYAAGHLLFMYERILMAQPFDARSGRVTDLALPLAVGLHASDWTGEAAFTASDGGLVTFRLDRDPPDQLAWFTVGAMAAEPVPGRSDAREARLAGDGRIAATTRDPATGMDDIWIVDRERQNLARLTSHPASDNSPVWSRDGSRLVFRSNRTGLYNLYQVDPATGAERLLLESTADDQPTDFSPSGELLFNRWSMDTRQDIWVLPAGGRAVAVLASEALETNGAFSPDGAWIAYQTNESGANQVHVRRYPIDGTSTRISLDGGNRPRWTADGRTVIYVRDDNRFQAVDLGLKDGALHPSPPRDLFITRPRISDVGGFDIDAAGTRILVHGPGPSGTPERTLTIIRHGLLLRP